MTTAAYDAFVESNGIRNAILGLASVPRGRTEAFEDVSGRIRALFAAEAGSRRGPEAIRWAWRIGQGAGGRAVLGHGRGPGRRELRRPAGDLPERARRGGAADGREGLLGLPLDRAAMACRARQGIAPQSVSLAVVVQEMVEAEAAGVMFTANPATGRRDEAVISAAWGLGESVVSAR